MIVQAQETESTEEDYVMVERPTRSTSLGEWFDENGGPTGLASE